MSIDIERLKVDSDYWSQFVSDNVIAAQDMGKGLRPSFLTKRGVEIFLVTGRESQLIYRPQPSPASLLTDEQAEARIGEPIVIERANVQQANIDGGLAVNDVILRKAGEPHDPVNSPSHYASGGIECIDAMQAMLSRDEFVGYLRGNIFKYQWRYKLKNGVEDLKKAQWYQKKLIEVESK